MFDKVFRQIESHVGTSNSWQEMEFENLATLNQRPGSHIDFQDFKARLLLQSCYFISYTPHTGNLKSSG